jgi:hypothetical protein
MFIDKIQHQPITAGAIKFNILEPKSLSVYPDAVIAAFISLIPISIDLFFRL